MKEIDEKKLQYKTKQSSDKYSIGSQRVELEVGDDLMHDMCTPAQRGLGY